MTYREIYVNRTDQHHALRDMVRKYGAEVMRPAGLELDKLPDPEEVSVECSKRSSMKGGLSWVL